MATQCTLIAGEDFKSSEAALRFYTYGPLAEREFLTGATSIKPPMGFTRNSYMNDQIGKFAYSVPTNVQLGDIPVELDWQLNDDLHQELYNRGKCQNDQFQDMWYYFRRSLFDPTLNVIAIPNHVDNPRGGMSVMNFDLPAKGNSDKFTVSFSLTQSISWIYTLLHIYDTSGDFTFAAPSGGGTITRTVGSWETAGPNGSPVLAGMKMYVDDEYSVTPGLNHRKIVTVDNVTPLVLTFVEDVADGYGLVAEAPVTSYVLRFGKQM